MLIMLIDDDVLTNALNSIVIQKQNPDTELIVFENALDALKYLHDEQNPKPELIFLDLNMPVMNGWDFMEEFEKSSFGAEVIILTSSDEPKDKEKRNKFASVKDYLIKPMSINHIKQMFTKYRVTRK